MGGRIRNAFRIREQDKVKGNFYDAFGDCGLLVPTCRSRNQNSCSDLSVLFTFGPISSYSSPGW